MFTLSFPILPSLFLSPQFKFNYGWPLVLFSPYVYPILSLLVEPVALHLNRPPIFRSPNSRILLSSCVPCFGRLLSRVSSSQISSEPGVVSQTRSKVGGHVKMNANNCIIRKRKRRSTTREIPICFILQELYNSCKIVFKGPGFVPSQSDEQSLRRILDRMQPEDLGLSKNLGFFDPANAANQSRSVAYANVYKCKDFSLALFFLPASAVIPLHNHPDMTVFSKLLIGKMHIKSYDWVDSDDSEKPSGLKLARLMADTDLTAPCETRVLYPTTGGNIHEFRAITPCVVLDVLGPPYSKEGDRDCTYYRDFPYDAPTDVEKYGLLEEIEMPENSRMVGIRYLGPQIIENVW